MGLGFRIQPDDKAGLEKGQKPCTLDETRGLFKEKLFAKDTQIEHVFEVLQKE